MQERDRGQTKRKEGESVKTFETSRFGKAQLLPEPQEKETGFPKAPHSQGLITATQGGTWQRPPF